MFETMRPAPPDPILGLTETFQHDARPEKINLSIGVFQDARGHTPVLECVRAAEQSLRQADGSRTYLPMAGLPAYGRAVQGLLLGGEALREHGARTRCAQTPGGTGALRIAGELLHTQYPGARIWLSRPTWPNHRNIFESAGMECREYPYEPDAHGRLEWEPMRTALEQAPAGDAVLLHACAHNPSGMDPDPAQWKDVAGLLHRRRLLPVVDMAYQGFAEGIEEDRQGLLELMAVCPEMLVASSFSKNFGLYRERAGALTLQAADADTAERVFGRVKAIVRAMYSNPPAQGALIVVTVLEDDALRAQWRTELDAMRSRLTKMRTQLSEGLRRRGWDTLAETLERQHGMFSYAGFPDEQVRRLREEYAVYLVRGGRLNVAGLTPERIDYVCDAMTATRMD